MFGPKTIHAQHLHAAKYLGDGEIFDDYCVRYSRTAADSPNHFRQLLDCTRDQVILPAGRQQLAVGRPYNITANNCFVGETIEDSSEGIFDALKHSMLTLRAGGGCGWDFSTIRPHGDKIKGLGINAYATGPVSFMGNWDAMCSCVMSAGHRRGAMMGVLNVHHPDIMRFINAKQDQNTLKNFNISVGITGDFIDALTSDGTYPLHFGGEVYGYVKAGDVWSRLMERNWDWADPGVLFIDRINEMNNLHYCEKINATNPCGEQPLPPHGTCLLGSINIVKCLITRPLSEVQKGESGYQLDFDRISLYAATACRAFDNVMDCTNYPLPQQRDEQLSKRRMGIGPTGMANALEILGYSYGTKRYIEMQDRVLETIRDAVYRTSIEAAKRLGSFPAFDREEYIKGKFIQTLPEDIRKGIYKHGIRNSHLLSIAPTGTISMCADNVSSGIEPPFALEQSRLINMPDGQRSVQLKDYAYAFHGVKGKTADKVSARAHVNVLCAAQKYIDSSVSKTCNVNGVVEKKEKGEVTFEEFKNLYLMAYKGGAKGCTTYNLNGKKFGILSEVEEGAACTIDPETGVRTCDG